MLNEKYKSMLNQKSVIRKMFYYALNRGKEIGYDNVFDYSLGNPSVPAPKEFDNAIIKLLKGKDSHKLHEYSPNLGIPEVREAVAQSLNERFDMKYKMEHIFMTSGAASSIAHALRCVTKPNDEVITFAPYFPEYIPYVNLTGAILKIVEPDISSFQINFEAFESMLNEKVKAILINSPNNPTGVVYSEDTIKTLTNILKRKSKEYGHEIFIISDEPYREISFKDVKVPYISKYYNNTISCYSFSKSISVPGERIGYVAVNPECFESELIAPMCGQISRGLGHNCPSSIIQRAIIDVLDKTSDLSVYETNMNILYNEFMKLGFECVKPDGTFYMFPKSLEPDANIFCEKAKKYNLIFVPGDSFGCAGHFRISYCLTTDKVRRSLKNLNAFVNIEYKNKINTNIKNNEYIEV